MLVLATALAVLFDPVVIVLSIAAGVALRRKPAWTLAVAALAVSVATMALLAAMQAGYSPIRLDSVVRPITAFVLAWLAAKASARLW